MTTYVQVVQHLRPGGIESLALDLAESPPADQVNWIVSLEGQKEAAIRAWPRLASLQSRLIFLNKSPGRDVGLIASLRHLFAKLGADVVQTHHIGPLLYGGTAARLARVSKLIHTEHDAWYLDNPDQAKLQRILLRFIRPQLVADARLVAEKLKVKLGLNAVNVILNGVNTDRFRPDNKIMARTRLALPIDVPLIGCSGRLVQVKGHSTLIDAFALLPKNIHLALAGTGPQLEALQNQVKELKLEHRVHFLGHLDDMPTFYQALDLFCLPSLREGFPLAPLEAQSCGKVAVITDVGAARETLAPQTGALVPPSDPATLANALSRCLKAEKTTSPRDFILRTASLERMRRDYQHLYREGMTDVS